MNTTLTLKDLQPSWDQNTSSFYHKAKVKEDQDTIKLYSYGTLACTIDKLTGEVTYILKASSTTTRHIHAFLVNYSQYAKQIANVGHFEYIVSKLHQNGCNVEPTVFERA